MKQIGSLKPVMAVIKSNFCVFSGSFETIIPIYDYYSLARSGRFFEKWVVGNPFSGCNYGLCRIGLSVHHYGSVSSGCP